MNPCEILLADDHEMLREGILAILQGEENLKVVDQASDGEEVMDKLSRGLRPDLIIMDLNMPNMDGMEATLQIKTHYPGVKVLILSMHNRPEFVKKLVKAGADGYVLKDSSGKELVEAIAKVTSGDRYFSEGISGTNIHKKPFPEKETDVELTDREKQVIYLIAIGKSTEEIAAELKLSAHTVNYHRKKLLAKTNTKNSAEITKYALRMGIAKGFDIK